MEPLTSREQLGRRGQRLARPEQPCAARLSHQETGRAGGRYPGSFFCGRSSFVQPFER